jgi:hypothetical protein
MFNFLKKKKEEPIIKNKNCFIAVSLDEDDEIFFDFAFNGNDVEEFTRLFILLNNGKLAEGMIQQITENIINIHGQEAATYFIQTLNESATEFHEEDENEPVVSPLDVFNITKTNETNRN